MKPFGHFGKIGNKGQLVIPNELRDEMKLEQGDAVTLRLEGTKLILERRKTVILSLLGKYASMQKPSKPIGGDANGA
jgi:AbrB family looped-hinge helix DNA binding protein